MFRTYKAEIQNRPDHTCRPRPETFAGELLLWQALMMKPSQVCFEDQALGRKPSEATQPSLRSVKYESSVS